MALSGPSCHLVVVFGLHNVEELAHLPHDLARHRAALDRLGVPAQWRQRDVMAVATTLLTGLAYALLRVAERRSDAVGDGMTLAVASALGGNAVTHALRATADRAYNGGLATSPLMLLAAVRAGGRARGRGHLTGRHALAIGSAANVAVPPLIMGSLAIAQQLVSRGRSLDGRLHR